MLGHRQNEVGFVAKRSQQQCPESMLVWLPKQTPSSQSHLRLDLKRRQPEPQLRKETHKVEMQLRGQGIREAADLGVACHGEPAILACPYEEISDVQESALAAWPLIERSHFVKMHGMHESIPPMHNRPSQHQGLWPDSHSVSLQYSGKIFHREHQIKNLKPYRHICEPRDKAILASGLAEHHMKQQPADRTSPHNGVSP